MFQLRLLHTMEPKIPATELLNKRQQHLGFVVVNRDAHPCLSLPGERVYAYEKVLLQVF